MAGKGMEGERNGTKGKGITKVEWKTWTAVLQPPDEKRNVLRVEDSEGSSP